MKRVDWLAPAPTTDTILAQLESTAYYAEFRAGDIDSGDWDNQDSVKTSLMRALRFIYY